MSRPVSIPHLKAKLSELFLRRRNAGIREARDLASALGIKENNISIWISGTAGVRGSEQVPDKHLPRICELFDVSPATMMLLDLEQFREVISQPVSVEGSWERMLQSVVPSSALRLIREGATDQRRGLELDELSETAIERISPNERVRVIIDLQQLQHDTGTFNYGLVFVVDPLEFSCLQPARRIAPDRELTRPITRIPDPSVTKSALRFKGALGHHSLIGILLCHPLPDSIYQQFETPQPRCRLERLANLLERLPPRSWRLLIKDFEVR